MAEVLEKKQGHGQRRKGIEEVVAYAISHRIRVQILIVLNEGTYSPAEVADIIDEPLNNVSNHMRELVEGGSIEVVDTRKRRNFTQHFYRATQTPEYSREDLEAMTMFEAQVTIGLAIQSMLAEIMASFWTGKMSSDPDVCLVWDRLNLDKQGRREVIDEQEESWERLVEIEKRSLLRAADSGEQTSSYVTGLLGFERARKAPRPSRSPFRE